MPLTSMYSPYSGHQDAFHKNYAAFQIFVTGDNKKLHSARRLILMSDFEHITKRVDFRHWQISSSFFFSPAKIVII